MDKKTFSQNYDVLKKSPLLDKALNLSLYNKQFIRGDLLNNKTLNLLDNYSSFNVVNKEGLKSYYQGSSISSRNDKFSHISNKSISFKSLLIGFNSKGFDNAVLRLNTQLFSLSDIDNSKKTLIIQSPVKAGFNCYSLGFSGFLPRSQVNYSLKVFFSKLSKGLYISFFVTNKFVNRITYLYTNLIMYPSSIRKNFSRLTKKRKTIMPYYNVVFVSKPKIKPELDKTGSNI